MLKTHYNIPGGSVEKVLEGIISHLTPKNPGNEYSGIANRILEDARNALANNGLERKMVWLDWVKADIAAAGLGLFGTIAKEDIKELKNTRYIPPSSRITQTKYLLTLYGSELNGGEYPLSALIAEDSRHCTKDSALNMFAEFAKRDGFKFATRIMEELQDNRKIPYSFNIPLSEENLAEKLKQEKERIYSDEFATDIQMARFFWDFIGMGIKKAGYTPEFMEGKIMSFRQPELDNKIELIAAYPTVPAEMIIGNIMHGMVNPMIKARTIIALRSAKDMPIPCIEDLLKIT